MVELHWNMKMKQAASQPLFNVSLAPVPFALKIRLFSIETDHQFQSCIFGVVSPNCSFGQENLLTNVENRV